MPGSELEKLCVSGKCSVTELWPLSFHYLGGGEAFRPFFAPSRLYFKGSEQRKQQGMEKPSQGLAIPECPCKAVCLESLEAVLAICCCEREGRVSKTTFFGCKCVFNLNQKKMPVSAVRKIYFYPC